MPVEITSEWTIDLPDSFQSRKEDEKLVFWKPGITIIIAAFRIPAETGKLELLNQIQQNQPENALETLVSTKGEIVGYGYTQIENIKNDKKRLSLITFTASDTSCLQTAFYLDRPDDLEWAKAVWESLIFHPDTDKNLPNDADAHP